MISGLAVVLFSAFFVIRKVMHIQWVTSELCGDPIATITRVLVRRDEKTRAMRTGGLSPQRRVVRQPMPRTNRWPNRMIGDYQEADANARDVQWKEGFLGGKILKTGRYTFTSFNPYKKDSKLLPSGLLGPVQLLTSE